MLDVTTLMACNGVLVVFIAIALVLYWSEQKTYFGFGMWIIAAILAALGYAAIILRGVIPVWLSILSNNAIFVLAGLCRLDGIIRFLNGRKLNRLFYALPIPLIGLWAYYYFADDCIAMRVLFLGITLFLMSVVAFRLLTKYAPANHKRLYWLAAILGAAFGVSILTRAILWVADPLGDLYRPIIFQSLYFLIAMIYEVGTATLFFMMNSQRTEDRLVDAQNELHATVTNLETALSEIKTLGGLLPICASCKKIRDDQGYWNQLETYISSHSTAEFSHSICPDCIKKLYPEIADEVLKRVEGRKKD